MGKTKDVRTARRVSGVTGVHNHLEVVLPKGDHRDAVKLLTAASHIPTRT